MSALRLAVFVLLLALAAGLGSAAFAASMPDDRGPGPWADIDASAGAAWSPTGRLRLRLLPQLAVVQQRPVPAHSGPTEPETGDSPFSPEGKQSVARAFERTWGMSLLGLGIAGVATTWTWRELRGDLSQEAMMLRWGVAVSTPLFFPSVLATLVNPAPYSVNLLGALQGGLILGGSAAIGALAGGVVVVLELFFWGWASLIIWESAFDVLAIIGPSFTTTFWIVTGLGYLASSFGVPWRFRQWAKKNPHVIEGRVGPTVLLDARERIAPGLQLSLRF